MDTPTKNPLSLWRSSQSLRKHLTTSALLTSMRSVLVCAIIAGVMIVAPRQSAQQVCSTESKPDCPKLSAKFDLAFIIDRSGSLDEREQGQTYNIQIEGVRRALLNPSVIPRDGSVAVAVFTFAEEAVLRVPFTEIRSAADAEAVAVGVEALRCEDATCPQKGPNPGTNGGNALLAANEHLNQNRRPGARRVLLMSTDGGFTDGGLGASASNHVRQSTAIIGIISEIDVILLGFELNKANAERIVFPKSTDALPGAILPIDADDCNKRGAARGCAGPSARQVVEFAEHTRSVLRSHVANRSLTVNTEADSPPNTRLTGDTLSLRQAIEEANCNGGATTITFSDNVKTIKPLVPLPGLTSPEIGIDGIDGCKGPTCLPSVTIDGSATDTTQGEKHSHGILIRSNRDMVRGLRIINFMGAGVGIDPVCPSDNIGFNRIELNTFEKNNKAGVCVIDPPQNQANAVAHNIGNTISMNTISGSETPIDLSCDGPTPNDPGDLDEGPNTLLNFPEKLNLSDTLNVTVTASVVSLTGQVSPPQADSVVEIFAITSFRPVSGGRDIDGVTFLASAKTNADGAFSVAGLPESPTCGYTATVTDVEGNTSEMMFPCAGFAKAKVSSLNFANVAVPNQNPLTGTFTIENTGCAPLVLRFISITRDEFPNKRSSDLTRFSIQSNIVGPGGQAITIEPGQTQTFTAMFDPAIPSTAGTNKPRASLVLPDVLLSTIKLDHNGSGDNDRKISVTARVNRAIRLINPKSPQNVPLATLNRSGDVFTVTFSVYDSNLDVDSVNYQLMDKNGRTVELDQPERNLSRVIRDGKLITGQSFTIRQEFTNAKQHPEVATVVVTVFDKEGNSDMVSASLSSATGAVSSHSLTGARDRVLVLPVVKVTPASKRSATRR